MTRYEFTMLACTNIAENAASITDSLNDLGGEGWHVVAAFPTVTGGASAGAVPIIVLERVAAAE